MLELLAKGLTNDEIGSVLGISPLTVRSHVTGVLENLHVSNRTEAAALFASHEARSERVSEILARPAVAVLAFRPLTDDPQATALARGFAQDIWTLFARWTWFPVLSDVPFAPGPAGAPTTDGRQSGARFLVHGALARHGSAWRLTAVLDDASTGRCLWTERYDFPQARQFEVYETLCESVVATAHAVLESQIMRLVPHADRVEDLDAWGFAHHGLDLERRRDEVSNRQAMEFFLLALEREPTLVLAHFGLGLCRYDQALNQWGRVGTAVDGLLSCARHCLELAPHAAEGFFLLGRALSAQGDLVGASTSVREAIGRNPSFAPAHALLAQILLAMGRTEEGLVRMKHAVRLGPKAYVAGAAWASFLNGDHAEALASAERALATTPGYVFARLVAVASAWRLGRADDAALHARWLSQREAAFSAGTFLSMFGRRSEGVREFYEAIEAVGVSA